MNLAKKEVISTSRLVRSTPRVISAPAVKERKPKINAAELLKREKMGWR